MKEKREIKPKKSLGQNFLTDTNILESIVLFAGVIPGSYILEIGPGRGALTKSLLEAGASVKAIELDAELAPLLEEQFGKNAKFSLTVGNILDIPLRDLVSETEAYQVVANIPYYITAPIVRKLLTEAPTPLSITLLVQKEVAERLAGGAKTRSVLTVSAQFYSRVQLGPVIARKYFDPVPKVDSQLVSFVPYRKVQESDEYFFRIVRVGFAARRKTLFNNLVAGQLGTKEKIQTIFTELTWATNRRAQDLEIEEWETLCQKLSVSESIREEKE